MTLLDGPRWGPRESGPAQQLVVLCHGLGADGQDLIDLAPYWGTTLAHAAFAAPDAPESCDMGPFGRQWFSLGDRAPAHVAAGVAVARQALDAFIDAELARLGLAPDAYALMGFSQGAMTALYTGLRRRVAPRGVLAFSGALIAADRLGEASVKPPVLIVHGEADTVVPAAHGRKLLEAAREPKTGVFIPHADHNNLDTFGLVDRIAAFLGGL